VKNAEPVPRRSVKPRKLRPSPLLPIIVVSRERVYIERSESEWVRDDLPAIVRSEPTSLVVVENHAAMVHSLHQTFRNDPLWQFRATAIDRPIYKPDGTLSRAVRQDTIVGFFGWRGENNQRGRWHFPLDSLTFCKATPGELRPRGYRIRQLYEWAIDVRDWCYSQGLDLRPTSGGIAAQLLRDPRFYGCERRKVPRATNDRARVQLPGNYYRLYTEPGRRLSATYLDMQNAHHWCATQVQFPHADRLYARGRLHTPDRSWASPGSLRFNQVLQEHGLLLVDLSVPHLAPGTFPPPYMEEQGSRRTYVYTNELRTIHALGGRIDGIVGAWTSRQADPGLSTYAAWALRQLEHCNQWSKPWLKPALLATYGILAGRPMPQRFGFAKGKGRDARFPTTSGPLEVKLIERGKVEPRVANVIHRGMIEAETRLQACAMARELHASGACVLSIYADSVFVEEGTVVPLLPAPWRVKGTLTRLEFFTPTAFVSDQMTKLPGIGRHERLRLDLMNQARQPIKTWKMREELRATDEGVPR